MTSVQRAEWGYRGSLFVVTLILLSAYAHSSDVPIGNRPFAEHAYPSYRLLDTTESTLASLGQSVFETQWTAAGTPGTTRTGVGPLFNASSCNACHHDGNRGRGLVGDGPAPVALVIQLEAHAVKAGAEPEGDPIYGRVFNSLALNGVQAEGAVMVRYSEIYGYYYPYGGRWTLRVPHYDLVVLRRGPLAPDTVIKPRLAPALFGAGLLEAVPENAIVAGTGVRPVPRNSGTPAWQWRNGTRLLARFGWQGAAISIRDQATNAFAREMGLTSRERPNDDCTAIEADCLAQRSGGPPEVTDDLLDALVAFLRTLAVPNSAHPDDGSVGSKLFDDAGCAVCHRRRLPVELKGPDGSTMSGVIAPYTDLRLHDLGTEMADQNASGTKVASRWRTAPLWGLGYRLKLEIHPTFLHDGRARTAEEAILWHSGEAVRAKARFEEFGPRDRAALLHWLEGL